MLLKKPATIAWMVLLLSFIACLGLAIGTPLLVRWYLGNATYPLQVIIQPRGGIVGIQEKGRGDVALLSDMREVPRQSRIVLSSADAEAFLLFYLPMRPDTPVGTLQLYGETDLTFLSARTPRFTTHSELPHQLVLQVDVSRELRVNLGGDADRTSDLQLQTPHGAVQLEDGSYTLAVDQDRTEIIVRQGRARIPDPADGALLSLVSSQRVELTDAGLGEIHIGGQRNILRNGDFVQSLDPHWTAYVLAKERPDQSDGVVLRPPDRDVVTFDRTGVGHIELGITQRLNQDVRGVTALYVTALLKVDQQSVPVCGANGTECPVMLRVTFLDTQGGFHEWLQGFYYLSGSYSNTCPISICESQPQHIQIPQSAWFAYTSPDLIGLMRERNLTPATLLSVDVYASGHTFTSEVDDVALLVEE